MLQERNVEERAKFHYYLAKLYAKRTATIWRCSTCGKRWKKASRTRRSWNRIPSSPACGTCRNSRSCWPGAACTLAPGGFKPHWLPLRLLAACGRAAARRPAPRGERIAILRFENLGADPRRTGWAARSRKLSATNWPARQAFTPFRRAGCTDRSGLWARARFAAPGISAERTAALVRAPTAPATANTGPVRGRVEARLTIEDRAQEDRAGGFRFAPDDVLGAAAELARLVSRPSASYEPAIAQALQGLCGGSREQATRRPRRSTYRKPCSRSRFCRCLGRLAQLQVARRDRAGRWRS